MNEATLVSVHVRRSDMIQHFKDVVGYTNEVQFENFYTASFKYFTDR